jgi:ergothioneine biosynthesis protein EgtB
VDAALHRLFDGGLCGDEDLASLLELGINHEQQHQELMLTDILSLFALNPLHSAYRQAASQFPPYEANQSLGWTEFPGGVQNFGATGPQFAFDNEAPCHKAYLQPFKLANRLVTNEEWLAFMDDKGYARPSLWLADGWVHVQRQGWNAPLYWEQHDSEWLQMTLFGLKPVERAAPVSHVSFYEAEAFAHWADRRLPTEFEWEAAAAQKPVAGNMLGSAALRPLPASSSTSLAQMFGDVWEWTQSAYAPYPGYRAEPSAIGEYNGKFMCNQQVLRGGSCVTPEGHIRATYRNFFFPHQRWQFCGLRLADEVL